MSSSSLLRLAACPPKSERVTRAKKPYDHMCALRDAVEKWRKLSGQLRGDSPSRCVSCTSTRGRAYGRCPPDERCWEDAPCLDARSSRPCLLLRASSATQVRAGSQPAVSGCFAADSAIVATGRGIYGWPPRSSTLPPALVEAMHCIMGACVAFW